MVCCGLLLVAETSCRIVLYEVPGGAVCVWQLVINPCCNPAIGSMDRSGGGSVNLMDTCIGRLINLSHKVRVDAAEEGAAFHSFTEKARIFLPKSLYLPTSFFDFVEVCVFQVFLSVFSF